MAEDEHGRSSMGTRRALLVRQVDSLGKQCARQGLDLRGGVVDFAPRLIK